MLCIVLHCFAFPIFPKQEREWSVLVPPAVALPFEAQDGWHHFARMVFLGSMWPPGFEMIWVAKQEIARGQINGRNDSANFCQQSQNPARHHLTSGIFPWCFQNQRLRTAECISILQTKELTITSVTLLDLSGFHQTRPWEWKLKVEDTWICENRVGHRYFPYESTSWQCIGNWGCVPPLDQPLQTNKGRPKNLIQAFVNRSDQCSFLSRHGSSFPPEDHGLCLWALWPNTVIFVAFWEWGKNYNQIVSRWWQDRIKREAKIASSPLLLELKRRFFMAFPRDHLEILEPGGDALCWEYWVRD